MDAVKIILLLIAFVLSLLEIVLCVVFVLTIFTGNIDAILNSLLYVLILFLIIYALWSFIIHIDR